MTRRDGGEMTIDLLRARLARSEATVGALLERLAALELENARLARQCVCRDAERAGRFGPAPPGRRAALGPPEPAAGADLVGDT
ncbi:MAG TPA: hypothetical protein VFL91_01385 [Thermomicrobiales bacterium]|nr:hypothetical protein [Thermomicrobiales bacterium]